MNALSARDILLHPTDNDASDVTEALVTAIMALDKQIPEKPLRGFDSGKFIDGRCPNCGHRQPKGDRAWKMVFNKYCRDCGQALDWSDAE